MRWRGRILWFALGVAAAVVAAKGRAFWQEWADPPFDVTVINDLGTPATITVCGFLRSVGLGEVRSDGKVSRTLGVSDLGEGPVVLRVAAAGGSTDYPLGVYLSDNGPFERVVNLTPEKAYCFFYTGTKGSWCGPLRPETDARPVAPTSPAR